ncbi:transposable element Tcb1 transposase [Trichonephila clavipes]|nr:transposable element Tcb1 transposase [Trichonephila clavipes]
MIPAYNKKRCAAFPFETGIHFGRKTDFFPEEDTTKSYSEFEPTRLQAEGHSPHTGWATALVSIEMVKPPSTRWISLTKNHRQLRLQWTHKRRAWQSDWHQVVFPDESRFSLWDHDGHIRVRLYAGER